MVRAVEAAARGCGECVVSGRLAVLRSKLRASGAGLARKSRVLRVRDVPLVFAGQNRRLQAPRRHLRDRLPQLDVSQLHHRSYITGFIKREDSI